MSSTRKTKEQKRAEAELRSAQSRLRREREERVRALERQISELETRQKELAAELEEEAVYEQPGRPMQLNRELTRVTDQLERLNREWETTAEQAQAEPSEAESVTLSWQALPPAALRRSRTFRNLRQPPSVPRELNSSRGRRGSPALQSSRIRGRP